MKKYVAVMRILFEKITNSGMEMSDEFDRYEEILRMIETGQPKEKIASLELKLYIISANTKYETEASKSIAYNFRFCVSSLVEHGCAADNHMAYLANLLVGNDVYAPEGAIIIEHMLNEVNE